MQPFFCIINAKYRRYMSHRMEELKAEHYVTEKQCKEMIDETIRQHNRNAFYSQYVSWTYFHCTIRLKVSSE